MLLRLRNAAASMAELAQRQDRVANNLANANTVGFRRDRAFATALAERIDREGAPQSTRVAGQAADLAPGEYVQTGNPLDLALDGDGFFAVRDADGRDRLTRAGAFVLDAEGTVRTADGHALLTTEGRPLTLPPSGGEVSVSTAGVVSVGSLAVGQVGTMSVPDPLALVRLDGATFDAAGAEPASARIRQGMVEGSNVDAVGEMVELMGHVRLFETQQKALRSADETLAGATRDLGSF